MRRFAVLVLVPVFAVLSYTAPASAFRWCVDCNTAASVSVTAQAAVTPAPYVFTASE